ncbi:ABC transporter permease [Citreimonas salinaria]|uniref:Putative ABC transport system permease protein n=1 Tax=Citreimonas salinaria TaxID=321339 RepID=A0A1H3EXD9_9RHOB|nr:ABC transporter permease [Citreimonas salinaria]SDX83401.1 putative ABC transport system permease protein [Citreimonas salinaria]
MNAAFLAFAHLRWHWARSVVMVLVAAVILAVPLVSQTLLRGSEQSLTARADATPLVLGARGSQIDLVMGALYFGEDRAQPVTMKAAEAVWESDLALPIPLNTMFTASGARIVGTTLDYFSFRGLEIAQGRRFAVLGEAVLGASVARRLNLSPGDTIVSAPENLFDLDGVYPLEMTVTGVLAPTGTPDDEAVLTDVKTTWVIAGIGHGHQDVVAEGDDPVTASAALEQYNRITPDNIDSFHFHGAPEDYPLTAVLIEPYDTRSETILRGRYLEPENPLQLVVPSDVVDRLVERIFRIAALLDAVAGLVGLAAAAAVALALFLAWRLRAPELDTARRIGAGRGMILRLAGAEIAILLGAALLMAQGIVIVVQSRSNTLLTWLIAQ